jgi:hypothetical protein
MGYEFGQPEKFSSYYDDEWNYTFNFPHPLTESQVGEFEKLWKDRRDEYMRRGDIHIDSQRTKTPWESSFPYMPNPGRSDQSEMPIVQGTYKAPKYFRTQGAPRMDTMQDMMGVQMADASGVNQRAKMVQGLQRKAQQMRKMGIPPDQIDLLLRGQMGMLEPEEEEAYMNAMRQFAGTQRVQGIPGMTKSLRSWSPDGGMSGGDAKQMQQQEALKALGFGGGGQMTLEDLMR